MSDVSAPNAPETKAPIEVLVFLRHYLPGYRFGGPLRSIANLVDHLGRDIRFRIVTLDRDVGDDAAYPDITPDQWQTLGAAQVMYLPAPKGFKALRALLARTPHDLIYVQSAFDPRFSVLPILANRARGRSARPVLLAPRGEFSPGALALKAPKKRAFLALARATGLWRGIMWQATAHNEHADIETQIGPGTQIMLAPNLPSVADQAPPAPAASTVLRLAFLSRISPKKNLSFALDVVAQLPENVPAHFTIYGPQEDKAYWAECAQKIAKLPEHVRATWGGSVEPRNVRATLACHDLFVFPTLGENFGHAIVDAMAAGLPLLLSDQTPWRGLSEKGVGADLPLDDAAAFTRWIADFAALPSGKRAAMRASVLAMAADIAKPEDALKANRIMFHSASREVCS